MILRNKLLYQAWVKLNFKNFDWLFYVYQKNSEVPKFDFRHIIDGEITKNRKGSTGGHKVGENVRVTRIFEKPYKNSVYQTKVEIYNPTKNIWQEKGAKTTMFPDDWSIEKTKWEINGAWNSNNFELKETIKGIHWEGTSPSGIKIEGYYNNNGISAFPVYEGGKK